MKLRINEAMAHYTLKTGEMMDKRDLACKLWQSSSPDSRLITIKKLIRGEQKRVAIKTVLDIAHATHTDPNFLFGWKGGGYEGV